MQEWVVLGMALLWVVVVGLRVWTAGPADSWGLVSMLWVSAMVLLPLALVWTTLSTARNMADLRAEAQRLQIAVDAVRHGTDPGVPAGPTIGRRMDDLAAAQRKTERAISALSGQGIARVATVPQVPAPEAQAALPLDTPAEDGRAPLSMPDLIRALHFPEGPDDRAGFRALRLALEDRKTSRLTRAAQDVLTLLSKEGIYMDDLRPDGCHPEVWRRFAAGERGRGIAPLGGVRDKPSLALTARRMREDPVFRDAAHHFLRSFDKTFAEFEPAASDDDLADLAETRTARAFMLFGRVTGTFD